jgi:serine/threonine-protein kinase RsbT
MAEVVQEIIFRVALRHESDIAAARLRARELATGRGLLSSAVEALATAVSEVARNVIVHAGGGEILLGTTREAGRLGVVAIARDDGPGITSIEDAMRDGYSTGTGLGLGLPGARRLVDEFELESVVGQGTTVILKKWLQTRA